MLWNSIGIDSVKKCRKALILVNAMHGVRQHRKAGYSPAGMLLWFSCSLATKEPIDRVYGILGMLKPEFRKNIHIDYSAETRAQHWRAYIELFKSLLVEDWPRMFVALNTASNPKLPSWCPDWDQKQGIGSIPYIDYSAGGKPSEHGLNVERITSSPTSAEVLIPGINVDTVIDTTDLTDINYWDGMPSSIPKYFAHMASADTRGRELLEQLRARFDIPLSTYARVLIANNDKHRGYPPGRQIEEDYEKTLENIRSYARPEGGGPLAKKTPYLSSLHDVCEGRSIFATEKGRLGVGPRATKPGDHVYVFFLGYCPMIMRKDAVHSTYRVLGDAYVEGLMKGEIYEVYDIKKDRYETFRVV